MKVRDAVGVEHLFGQPPQRIVSLVPSITETLFDLGAGEALVGITDFCIFPEEIPEAVVRLGGTKNPDLEVLRSLEPDLVHMNVEENLPRHARRIEEFSTVFATEPKRLEDVRALIEALGEIHGTEREAGKWIERLDEARSKASLKDPFSFVCPIWKDPWMWCGGDTYVSDLASSAGGRNLLGEQLRYPRVPLETVLRLDPDVIFLPDEPYEFDASDAAETKRMLGGRGEVIGPFPGHLFTWHGTRTIRGLEFLCEVLR